MRLSLPETHLERWGYEIERSDVAHYASIGMRDHVAFLSSPIAAHSSAPSATPDWELAHYAPRNLYERIWLPDGGVNPENYWASYVFRAVTEYHAQVRIWEVWNEPDQVAGNWMATEQWATRAPTPAELLWWNDTIYAYVRLLRITKEVVARVDPTGRVATGGLGYANFLDAILRFTDNPTDGSVSAEYPVTGGAYFDVLSYHFYPNWTPGSSDSGAAGIITSRDRFAAVMSARGVSGKDWVITESGASRIAVGTTPGGDVYARNYLLKSTTLAHAAGILGVDWYGLTDARELGETTESFDYMGLYRRWWDATNISEVVRTPSGVAYETLATLLADARHDPDASSALGLGATTAGAAFRLPSGRVAYVLWATTGATEDASATLTLATSSTFVAHAWDWSATDATTTLTAGDDGLAFALTGAPQTFVEQ